MRLPLRGADSGQQVVVGTVVSEALAGARGESEIDTISADQSRHAFYCDATVESGFYLGERKWRLSGLRLLRCGSLAGMPVCFLCTDQSLGQHLGKVSPGSL